MKKDFLIRIIVGIIEAAISTPLWIDKINNYLSLYFNTYWKWLLLESIFIVFLGYLAGYVFNVPKIFGLKRKSEEKIFKIKASIKILRIALYALPNILGILYFAYYQDISFRRLNFKDDKLNILVAEFREAALDKYELAQGKYSVLLKEKIKDYNNVCLNSSEFKIETTKAFFTSYKEADYYARKAKADIVIWGELSKTEGYISISPKISSPHLIEFSLADKEFMFRTATAYTENWRIDGTALTTDTLLDNLSATIFLFMLPILKSKNKSDIFEYEKCVLENNALLPMMTAFAFNYDLGFRYFNEKDRSNSLLHYLNSLSIIYRKNFRIWNKDYFTGLITSKISKNYYFLFEDSLAEFYARESIKYWPDFMYDINVYTLAYMLNNKVEESLDSLLNRWEEKPDTLTGDYVLNIFRTLQKKPSDSFISRYNILYPGRFNKLKGGIVIYIKHER